MKKTILVILVVICAGFTVNAQRKATTNAHAIGLRLDYGAEISYQHGLGSNRIEADLGWWNNGFSITGVYHWVFNIDGGFNWYVGPGASLKFYNDNSDDGSGVGLGIGGQIGIEYNFDFPLQLSLDARPMWDVLYSGGGFHDWVALGIRYKF